MPIFNQAAALTTSKSAIGVGICFTVGDAVVQYFVHKVELQVSPRPPAAADPPAARPDGPRRPGSPTPPEYAWDTGRTYCAFVVGSTLGITVTAVKMLVQGSPWQGLLASVLPAELMLLPFQAIACTGHSDHFARNLPGYMMLLTLVQLVVGYPTLIWGLVAPKNELLTGLPTLIATEVQELLLGFSAVGIFIFANRYPEKQWVMPLVGDTTDLMAHCNQPLIVIGQVLGVLGAPACGLGPRGLGPTRARRWQSRAVLRTESDAAGRSEREGWVGLGWTLPALGRQTPVGMGPPEVAHRERGGGGEGGREGGRERERERDGGREGERHAIAQWAKYPTPRGGGGVGPQFWEFGPVDSAFWGSWVCEGL